MSEKKIYNHFGGFLMDIGFVKKIDKISLKDQLEEYSKILMKNKTKIVVLLHSIDGPNIMNPDSQ